MAKEKKMFCLNKQLHTNSPFSIAKKKHCSMASYNSAVCKGLDQSQNKPWLVANFW